MGIWIMENFNYTPEMVEFLKNQTKNKLPWHEVVDAFNKKFKTNKSVHAVRLYCYRHGFYKPAPIAYNKTYTEEMENWLRDNSLGIPWKKIAENFNKRFKTDKKITQIKAFCKKCKIYNGIDRLSYNAYKEGEVRKGGYFNQIKINGKWRSHAVYVYEKTHNIKVNLKKYRIIHLDRNLFNDDPENLYMFPIKNIQVLGNFAHEADCFTKEMLDSLLGIANLMTEKTQAIKKVFGTRSKYITFKHATDPKFAEKQREYWRNRNRRVRQSKITGPARAYKRKTKEE